MRSCVRQACLWAGLGVLPGLTAPAQAAPARPRATTPAQRKARKLFAKGYVYYANGEYLKAIRNLKLAYTAAPTPVVQFYIGKVFQSAGLRREAAKAYRAFLRSAAKKHNKRPAAMAALSTMGRSVRGPASPTPSAAKARAVAQPTTARRLRPRHFRLLPEVLTRGVLTQRGRGATTGTPRRLARRLAAARGHLKRGRLPQALRLLARALRAHPNDVIVRALYGEAQARAGDFSGALRTIWWLERRLEERDATQLRSLLTRLLR